MKVRIAGTASQEEATAIASALAQHRPGSDPIEVYVGDAADPVVVHNPAEDDGDAASDGAATGDGAGPTDRERTLREEIADIYAGGPGK